MQRGFHLARDLGQYAHFSSPLMIDTLWLSHDVKLNRGAALKVGRLPELSSSIIVIWKSFRPVNLSEVEWESFKYSVSLFESDAVRRVGSVWVSNVILDQTNVLFCRLGCSHQVWTQQTENKGIVRSCTEKLIRHRLFLWCLFLERRSRQIAYFTWDFQCLGGSSLLVSQSCHVIAKALTVRFHCSVILLIQLDRCWTIEIQNTRRGHELYIQIIS